MQRINIGSILCWLFCAAFALADDGAHIERNAQGERIWHITDYVKGTSSQIHDILCHETRHFNNSISATTRAIAEDKETIEADRNFIITAQLQRADYLQAKVDAVTYKEQLDKARANHDSAAALEAGSLYNKARDVIAQCEKAANKTADDSDVVKRDKVRLSREQEGLKGYQAGLKKAAQWHDELVNAIQNTYLLQWPLVETRSGTLGEIIPTEVDRDGNITCTFKAREDVSVKETGEGFATIRQRIHPVVLIIKGAKAKAADVPLHHPMRFDHNVEVSAVKFIADDDVEAIGIVEVKHADVDDLMDAIAQP